MIKYTKELRERIVELASDPKNLRDLTPEEQEYVQSTSAAIETSLTEDDWRRLLNAMVPSRAVREIIRRPAEDRQRFLGLMTADHRAEVERLLTVAV